jgi:type I restriction enzyme M protein
MNTGLTLVCPIRGRLKAKARSKDGLSPTEERFRVEAIKHLIECGYPKENIRVEATIKRFGNSGRNSFRADLLVLDVPLDSLSQHNVDELLQHALILGEVKRDNARSAEAVSYQVKPMLDFAVRDDCVALYWDDVEQRVYWIARAGGKKKIREGPLADMPGFGQKPGARALTLATIDPNKPLLQVFKRIEDILHSASVGPSKRFSVMLQLLLAKLYDEHQHESVPDAPLALQDFAALGVEPVHASVTFNRLLEKAVQYYQSFLPEPVAKTLPITGDVLLEVMRVLAPIKVVSMRQALIQDFYMYFAKHVYKWDLAQYFTPTALTDFIIEILNPQFGEHIKDPACGSADFLTAAFRRGQRWPDYASSVWGSDVSPEAVQVAVLNMILNGDGKTNIREEDSLAKIEANHATSDIVVCNPPFGTRIVERSTSTLLNFDLGHTWVRKNGRWEVGKDVLDSQESGILFAEACVKLLRPQGRLALIVPNGYLGNRSTRYSVLREWLLRQCRIAVIVALPRFTFKSSGADVSASVIFCEKRETPLRDATEGEEYEFSVEVVDRVGWMTGDKRGRPIYRRDATDGTLILDKHGQPILDSDFSATLAQVRGSEAAQYFDWLVQGLQSMPDGQQRGWAISIGEVLNDQYRTLDPKRHCRKFIELRRDITSAPHFAIGDVADFIPEKTSGSGKKVKIEPGNLYRHVEIQDVETGSHRSSVKPGWELPQRARHIAEPGDIFLGGIRNSVRKWFLAGEDTRNLVVTNGMHRLRLKDGCDEYLLDLIIGLCSEAYRVQMRALARGADGLAEIAPEDVATVVLSRIDDPATREEFRPFVDQLRSGVTTLEAKVDSLLEERRLPLPNPPARPDHTSLV